MLLIIIKKNNLTFNAKMISHSYILFFAKQSMERLFTKKI